MLFSVYYSLNFEVTSHLQGLTMTLTSPESILVPQLTLETKPCSNRYRSKYGTNLTISITFKNENPIYKARNKKKPAEFSSAWALGAAVSI